MIRQTKTPSVNTEYPGISSVSFSAPKVQEVLPDSFKQMESM